MVLKLSMPKVPTVRRVPKVLLVRTYNDKTDYGAEGDFGAQTPYDAYGVYDSYGNYGACCY